MIPTKFLPWLRAGLLVSVLVPGHATAAARPGSEPRVERLGLRFESLRAGQGLAVSITVAGDADGKTTFSNTACCGVASAQQFIRDVRVQSDGRSLAPTRDGRGWTVQHAPGALLQLSYRLPPTGPMSIDTGVPDQLRPIVRGNLFHVVGTFGLLLPQDRSQSDPVQLQLDATKVADKQHFVSSFGPGNQLSVRVTRAQLAKALYLGGAITLSLHDTPKGRVAIAFSAMDKGFAASAFSGDALAILAAEREFFNDSQPWYLVSLHGGVPSNPVINLGGGMGLTSSFVMFARSDLDAASQQHREQFRWVLAHEYFHNWNGLGLRVAARPDTGRDDVSAYWFSEGVTEFYTMRLLTRIGLQTSARSVRILDNRLERYAANGKRALGAEAAAKLFWSDPDGEQIPYLRGYLAAWTADLALRRQSSAKHGLDASMRALVARAKAEPAFRVDNAFLVPYLAGQMSTQDARAFRRFVLQGGDVALDPESFAPCLSGAVKPIKGVPTLQFEFAHASDSACFAH